MTRYALVIGIQKYDSGFDDLQKPVEDAEAIAQVLEKYGNFHPPIQREPCTWNSQLERHEVTPGTLNGSELVPAIHKFLDRIAGHEALIYFSGHGDVVQDILGKQSGYLVASDGSEIPLTGLIELIVQAKWSNLTLLLDCCYSGIVLEQNHMQQALAAIIAHSNRNFFVATACRRDEQAYEEKDHGIFTAAVLEVLKTPGTVKTSDLRGMVAKKLHGSGQQPFFWGSESITLTYPAEGKTKVAGQHQKLKDPPRIPGLTPFGNNLSQGPFRAYLNDDKLPYYSRSAHLAIDPPPSNIPIPSEAQLLQQLAADDLTGLIITGSGGVGKTRLTLELGRMALADGWLVFRVRARLKAEGIATLADWLDEAPSGRAQTVLLLVDYVETQRDFAELVESLTQLNEDEGFQFRYIANCRTTYYNSIEAQYTHRPVNVSPPDEAWDWFQRYRAATVRHILQASHLGATEAYLNLCGEVPMLAVFLTYLHSRGSEGNLNALTGEADFGQWLTKRMHLSFPKIPGIEKELALLIAQFPLSQAIAEQLYRSPWGDLFQRLATDGWIEQESGISETGISETGVSETGSEDSDPTWVTIHDVLADRVVKHYLDSAPQTVEFFVKELLAFAIEAGSLRSTLYTLQRLSDCRQLQQLDWFKLLNQQLEQTPLAWKATRDLLLQTSFLLPSEQIQLLDRNETVWQGIETGVDFQNALAWFARQYLKEESNQSEALRATLTAWIAKAAPQVSTVNLLLNWGLRLCPDVVQDATLNWIVRHPRQLQTHYLLVAWIESDLPHSQIQKPLSHWLSSCATAPQASFVYQTWLKSGGIKTWIQAPLLNWLSAHGTTPDAGFVYPAWLNAGGDKSLVQTALLDWLSAHGSTPDARFVYKAWLDAEGNKSLVQSALLNWLSAHGSIPDAQFVYKAWLNAGGDKALVQTALLDWLSIHGTTPEARFVYHAWLDAGGDKTLVQDLLLQWLSIHGTTPEAQFVYPAWLNAGGDKALVQTALLAWLVEHGTTPKAQFVYNAWLDAGGDKALVQTALLAWLAEHGTTPEAQFVYKAWLNAKGSLQLIRDSLVRWFEQNQGDPEIDYLCRAWLKEKGEFEIVRDAAIKWFHKNWENEDAVFLMQSLLRQPSLPIETLTCTLRWCQKFPTNPNTLARFTLLGTRLFEDELAEDICLAAKAVLSPWLGKNTLDEQSQSRIYLAFSYLVGARSLQTDEFRSRVDALFLTWLRNPISFGAQVKPARRIQRFPYFQRIIDLIERGKLDVEADRFHLSQFLTWIDLWEPENKQRIYKSWAYLKHTYPAPELWEMVQFEQP